MIPSRTSGPRHGLSQNRPVGPRVAAPIDLSLCARVSHAQVVKSLNPLKSWYSFQTSQRPSRAAQAWLYFGLGNALILVRRPVLASICPTPENLREYTLAKKERPSSPSESGTIAVVREEAMT